MEIAETSVVRDVVDEVARRECWLTTTVLSVAGVGLVNDLEQQLIKLVTLLFGEPARVQEPTAPVRHGDAESHSTYRRRSNSAKYGLVSAFGRRR